MELPYEYELPKEKIAQRPVGLESERSRAKLLYAKKRDDSELEIKDRYVRELPEILRSGDLLVMNNSRVLPYRFFVSIGLATKAEVLLVREQEDGLWEALARPMKRFRSGMEYDLSLHLKARVEGRNETGEKLLLSISVQKDSAPSNGAQSRTVADFILEEGQLPIPGYIRGGVADEADSQLYQTVFAEKPGSLAAPTAGLHFTQALLAGLAEKGISHVTLTLHVGLASFLPVRDVSSHKMAEEFYEISPQTVDAIKRTKQRGGRIVAVGTTSTRALESMMLQGSEFRPNTKYPTTLFIKPGFRFRAVDVLMTNFHQPGTTHLLLVSAFIGKEAVQTIYEHGLAADYRFLSYGDAMLLDSDNF